MCRVAQCNTTYIVLKLILSGRSFLFAPCSVYCVLCGKCAASCRSRADSWAGPVSLNLLFTWFTALPLLLLTPHPSRCSNYTVLLYSFTYTTTCRCMMYGAFCCSLLKYVSGRGLRGGFVQFLRGRVVVRVLCQGDGRLLSVSVCLSVRSIPRADLLQTIIRL